MRLAPLALVLLWFASAAWGAAPPTAAAPAVPVPPAAVEAPVGSAGPSLADIQTFTRVFELVRQAYVDKVDDHTLMQSAITGMLAGLDPHSEFLTRKGLEQLDEETSGRYGGLGIEVAQINGQLRVIAPIDGTPAARAGMLPGDVILGINGRAVDPDALNAAVDQLRGAPGTTITLSVLHPQASKPVELTLTRERIQIASVRSRLLQPGYAYLRISQFQDDTVTELTRQIEALQKKGGPLQGAVLDLRSNPGGLVTAAVGVADDFLDHGTIVSTRGRLKQADMTFTAQGDGDLLKGAPLVVLVDNGTASAAEIVAGALKDNHRAVLMGRRTFGKGSVQTLLPLPGGDAVKLTTARYYTPDGGSIQARGIEPDIRLADATVRLDHGPQLIQREADLPNHLAGNASADSVGGGEGKLAGDDYWLSEALHVAQGLAVARATAASQPAPRNR